MFRTLMLAGSLAAVSTSLFAQDNILSELYGRGVHDYFAGRSQRALEQLTQAIDAGSRDPRAYYFRGLVQQQLGDCLAAEDDFRQAAALEVADSDEFYAVGRALERIQGNRRLEIERIRTEARLAEYQRQQYLRRQRYETIQGAEPEVTIPVQPEPLPADTLPERESETEMPLEEPAELPAAPGEEPAESPADDPFGAPAEEMPAAPADVPPTEAPLEEPVIPADEPLPPAEVPADAPPAEAPPAEAPPAETPEVELPPVEEPAAPPATEPAAPPADDPFAEPPPAAPN